MAALDANACGLPVVTVEHRMNAVMDLVTENTGIICPPAPEDLADGLLFGSSREPEDAQALPEAGTGLRLGEDLRSGGKDL